MRRYVSVLAEEVEKRKRLNPGPTLDDLAASDMVAPTAPRSQAGSQISDYP
jgi:hypothetical protein